MSHPRIPLQQLAPTQYRAMLAFDRSIELAPVLRELLKVRASQINGCAFCIDMHWKDARSAGETEERLYSLSAWRHSPLYDAREQAALELCEAITLITTSDVPDDVWDRTSEVFSAEEQAQLIFAITAINAWNRIASSTRAEPGKYQPAPRTPATTGNGETRAAD